VWGQTHSSAPATAKPSGAELAGNPVFVFLKSPQQIEVRAAHPFALNAKG